jgi:uncharacterized protein (TIGR00251 family)
MLVTIHLHPNAHKTAIEWLDTDTAKAWVTAAPEKGKANQALIELLASEFNLPKSRVSILRGNTTRIKQVEILKNSV